MRCNTYSELRLLRKEAVSIRDTLHQSTHFVQKSAKDRMSEHQNIILIIDDEEVPQITLGALLEVIGGYQIETADNGPMGIQKARELFPDLILLDIMMPGMDGYEVCQQLRADPQLSEVPIFMITALDDKESRLQGLLAGADDFLSKPIDSLELKIRLNVLKQVDRYRHLLTERKKLQDALSEVSQKNTQLHFLSQRILTVQEEERRRLALELHDEVGQVLTGLKFILEQKDADTESLLAEARTVTADLLRRVREMSVDLRPTVLDDLGLFAALDWLFHRHTRQTGIVVHHNIDPFSERRFEKIIETTIFRVTQEALTNIARHAGVTEANVTLMIDADHLQLEISDSGIGFDITRLPEHTSSGISGMEERVTLAGGTFKIRSMPGEGTLITVDLDLLPME